MLAVLLEADKLMVELLVEFKWTVHVQFRHCQRMDIDLLQLMIATYIPMHWITHAEI